MPIPEHELHAIGPDRLYIHELHVVTRIAIATGRPQRLAIRTRATGPQRPVRRQIPLPIAPAKLQRSPRAVIDDGLRRHGPPCRSARWPAGPIDLRTSDSGSSAAGSSAGSAPASPMSLSATSSAAVAVGYRSITLRPFKAVESSCKPSQPERPPPGDRRD